MNKFNIIIDKFIEEIQERFQSANYEPVIELFKLITNNNIEKKANFEKLQLYKNFLDFDNLKLQEEAFIIYKNKFKDIKWNSMKDLCFNFLEKKLDSFFPEIFKAIKIYLSIPVGTPTAERSFSCLKLIKSWLRSVMANDRLSELTLIKMFKDDNFEINYDLIVKDFNALGKRKLNLV